MRVCDIMTVAPTTCQPHDMLNEAARLMWDNDCGWLPVIENGGRLAGVITDRDICMAAYTRGNALSNIAVAGTMSTNVHACHEKDDVQTVEALMRAHRVRRVPVTDKKGRLVGLVSVTDLAVRAGLDTKFEDPGMASADVVSTIAAICEPRSGPPVA